MVSEVGPLRTSSADDPNAWVVLAEHRLWAAETVRAEGSDDTVESEAAALIRYVDDETWRHRRWAAVAADGQVLGVAALSMGLRDNLHLGDCSVIVADAARGHGVGRLLAEPLIAAAEEEGRRVLVGWAYVTPSDAEGSVPVATGTNTVEPDASVRFAMGQGFTLEQVEARSQLTLPVDADVLTEAEAEARAASVGYVLVGWGGRCPDEWVEQFCALRSAMSDDVPKGEVQSETELWDEARLRRRERRASEMGIETMILVAVHEESGALAGYTEVERKRERLASVAQEDTLVLQEHRGRRLGLLLKTAMLRRVAEQWPEAERIGTYNAEENSVMLGINVRLGFRPTSADGLWQRVSGLRQVSG